MKIAKYSISRHSNLVEIQKKKEQLQDSLQIYEYKTIESLIYLFLSQHSGWKLHFCWLNHEKKINKTKNDAV